MKAMNIRWQESRLRGLDTLVARKLGQLPRDKESRFLTPKTQEF